MSKINREKLYIGANYHPHDWDEQRWKTDLDLMKNASMNVVRLGHLCWDSFEPEEGVFDFEWMDKVMDLCAEREIEVFLDIPTRPAPTWLHEKFPEIDITDKSGARQSAHSRYMEDVGDPNFQKYALRLAEKMADRYKNHPALIAFGLCNELGSGFISYSESARVRFTKWLKEKYKTVECLNNAWAGKRWSRKVCGFESVQLPISSQVIGAPERFLDMRRFYSDEIIGYLKNLKKVVQAHAPNIQISTNHWSENPSVGFDYQSCYKELFDFSGQGFYPGINPEAREGILGACFYIDHRAGELNVPNWNLEFQTGSFGGYSCPKNAMRMYAYLTYLHGSQAICAWTWRSMLAGEEQYLFGLLDHDGQPSKKYHEFKQIADEAKMLWQNKILPLKPEPQVAIAFSFESMLVSNYGKDYYTTPYTTHLMAAYTALFNMNLSCAIVNLKDMTQKYKVVIIPGHCVMDDSTAKAIKELVRQGTTVIMTAFSAKVDTNSKVFDTPLPGKLTDVFGIKVRGFDRSITHVASVNEGCLEKNPLAIRREHTQLVLNGKKLNTQVNYHEYLQLDTAQGIGQYTGCDNDILTAVSLNNFGLGKGIYAGIPADESLIASLITKYAPDILNVAMPEGVVCRSLNLNRKIYINTTPLAKEISTTGTGLLSGKSYNEKLILEPYQVEIIS